MASIRKRTGKRGVTYLAEVRLRGCPTARKSFSRKTDARRWAAETETAIHARRYFRTAEAERHTVAEMLQRYRIDCPQAATRGTHLDWFESEIGQRRLSDITTPDLVELRAKLSSERTRSGRKRQPATVNRYLATLSHVYSRAVKEWEWLQLSPMGNVGRLKEPHGRTRFLSDTERERLLEVCLQASDPLIYPFVVLALSTGARAGELKKLRWQDINLGRGIGTLYDTKNGETRALPIKGHARDQLIALSKVRRIDTDLIFPNQAGIKPWDYTPSWRQVVKESGLSDFRFHDLRHSCASYLVMNGATTAEVAGVLGHRTLQMVKRYAHLSDEHIADTVASMNNKIFGG